MRLEAFFQAIAPFLEGTATHAEAQRALWGTAPPEPDAGRLAIYGRFCRTHRFEAVDSVFSETRAAIVRSFGERRWAALVDAHFRRHRMHHAELNENGLTLPAFLADPPEGDEARDLPSWIAGLADLEAWVWRTRVAPDADTEAAPEAGPLRLASTVEARPYRHDLVTWLDGPRSAEGHPALDEPARAEVRVIFWRDHDLDPRRENASELELAVLKAVFEGTSLERQGEPGPWRETIDDLRAAGILLGAR